MTEQLFGLYAGSLILMGIAIAGVVIVLADTLSPERLGAVKGSLHMLARPLSSWREREPSEDSSTPEADADLQPGETYAEPEPPPVPAPAAPLRTPATSGAASYALRANAGEYKAPPLSLLERDRGKAGVGDIKANANIIKRTLANFGIVVELDEISIGPSVTRYAIKPAEGVRLQKIVGLQNNLELALAASPVRIEAPIPGKSLVGIEVPNSSKMTVGLGTMLATGDFASSNKSLLIALGRDIAGSSHFANIAKMPHLLIAGATGSGKSVTIHTLITSLLYRNSPQALRFIMIDPKRVELTLYKPLPHLLSPVITDPKKAVMALRWAGKEMARRYDILEASRVRDIESYHQNVLGPKLEKLKKGGDDTEGDVPDPMPYIVIVIDELADIMQTFPRELEAAIVRLAQMSRAVGIHLVLSTQRPSVNVITGLIKANVPARIALQVASQIDSRTIIDMAGAEKLLGAGDMLYLSGDMGKPVRLQSAYISEEEVKRVADYVGKNNEVELPIDFGGGQQLGGVSEGGPAFSSGGMGEFGDEEGGDEDDMYEAAKTAVQEAGKASTSYLQRKLRVGYARAARLMDILEERGVIGPGEGAKPREVFGATKNPAMQDESEM
jgi:S-DNA-T family DNA segregation ATPase FtsK/SpoIIIE